MEDGILNRWRQRRASLPQGLVRSAASENPYNSLCPECGKPAMQAERCGGPDQGLFHHVDGCDQSVPHAPEHSWTRATQRGGRDPEQAAAWENRMASEKSLDWQEIESIMAGYWDAREREDWAGGLDCAEDTSGLQSALQAAGYPIGEEFSGYYVMPDGRRASHDWLTLGGKILDMTHGQFGKPNFLITEAGDPRYLSTEQAEGLEDWTTDITRSAAPHFRAGTYTLQADLAALHKNRKGDDLPCTIPKGMTVTVESSEPNDGAVNFYTHAMVSVKQPDSDFTLRTSHYFYSMPADFQAAVFADMRGPNANRAECVHGVQGGNCAKCESKCQCLGKYCMHLGGPGEDNSCPNPKSGGSFCDSCARIIKHKEGWDTQKVEHERCSNCLKYFPSTQMAGGTCRSCRPAIENVSGPQAPETPADVSGMKPADRQKKIDALLDRWNKEPEKRPQIEEQLKSLRAFKTLFMLRSAGNSEQKLLRELVCTVVGSDSGETNEAVLPKGTVVGVQPWSNDHTIFFYSPIYSRIIVRGKVMKSNQYSASVQEFRAATDIGYGEGTGYEHGPECFCEDCMANDDMTTHRCPTCGSRECPGDGHSIDCRKPGTMTLKDVPVETRDSLLDKFNGGEIDEKTLRRRMKQITSSLLSRWMARRAAADLTDIFQRVTGIPWFDNMMENPEYYKENKGVEFSVTDMSPDEYLERVRAIHDSSVEQQQAMIDSKNVGKLKKLVKSGVKLFMPHIEYFSDGKTGAQEGRHRASLAKLLGIQSIPVLVVTHIKKQTSAAANSDGLRRPAATTSPADCGPRAVVAPSGNLYDCYMDHANWFRRHFGSEEHPAGWVRFNAVADLCLSFDGPPTEQQWSTMSKLLLVAEGSREFFVEDSSGSIKMDCTATVDQFRRSGKRLKDFCTTLKYDDVYKQAAGNKKRLTPVEVLAEIGWTPDQLRREVESSFYRICREHRDHNVTGIFLTGSRWKRDNDADSDLDVLVRHNGNTLYSDATLAFREDMTAKSGGKIDAFLLPESEPWDHPQSGNVMYAKYVSIFDKFASDCGKSAGWHRAGLCTDPACREFVALAAAKPMKNLGPALDRANNFFGALDPEIRRRIVSYMSAPSAEAWADVRGIIISSQVGRMGTTLWQAMLKQDSAFNDPALFPAPEQLMFAIERSGGDSTGGQRQGSFMTRWLKRIGKSVSETFTGRERQSIKSIWMQRRGASAPMTIIGTVDHKGKKRPIHVPTEEIKKWKSLRDALNALGNVNTPEAEQAFRALQEQEHKIVTDASALIDPAWPAWSAKQQASGASYDDYLWTDIQRAIEYYGYELDDPTQFTTPAPKAAPEPGGDEEKLREAVFHFFDMYNIAELSARSAADLMMNMAVVLEKDYGMTIDEAKMKLSSLLIEYGGGGPENVHLNSLHDRWMQRISKKRKKKGSVEFGGLPISLEFKPGDERTHGDGNTVKYLASYGEIDGTSAMADRMAVDVYLRENPEEDAPVFIVHQLKKDKTHDEDKVMLGYPTEAAAKAAYEHHGPPYGFGAIDEMTLDQFVNGYLKSNKTPEDMGAKGVAKSAAQFTPKPCDVCGSALSESKSDPGCLYCATCDPADTKSEDGMDDRPLEQKVQALLYEIANDGERSGAVPDYDDVVREVSNFIESENGLEPDEAFVKAMLKKLEMPGWMSSDRPMGPNEGFENDKDKKTMSTGDFKPISELPDHLKDESSTILGRWRLRRAARHEDLVGTPLIMSAVYTVQRPLVVNKVFRNDNKYVDVPVGTRIRIENPRRGHEDQVVIKTLDGKIPLRGYRVSYDVFDAFTEEVAEAVRKDQQAPDISVEEDHRAEAPFGDVADRMANRVWANISGSVPAKKEFMDAYNSVDVSTHTGGIPALDELTRRRIAETGVILPDGMGVRTWDGIGITIVRKIEREQEQVAIKQKVDAAEAQGIADHEAHGDNFPNPEMDEAGGILGDLYKNTIPKLYMCRGCGAEKVFSTNHWGDIYEWCSNSGQHPNYERGQLAWVCAGLPPEADPHDPNKTLTKTTVNTIPSVDPDKEFDNLIHQRDIGMITPEQFNEKSKQLFGSRFRRLLRVAGYKDWSPSFLFDPRENPIPFPKPGQRSGLWGWVYANDQAAAENGTDDLDELLFLVGNERSLYDAFMKQFRSSPEVQNDGTNAMIPVKDHPEVIPFLQKHFDRINKEFVYPTWGKAAPEPGHEGDPYYSSEQWKGMAKDVIRILKAIYGDDRGAAEMEKFLGRLKPGEQEDFVEEAGQDDFAHMMSGFQEIIDKSKGVTRTKPSRKTEMTEKDVAAIPELDVPAKTDQLLEQLNTETDPEKKKMIEQQIRSLQASILGRWLLRRAANKGPLPGAVWEITKDFVAKSWNGGYCVVPAGMKVEVLQPYPAEGYLLVPHGYGEDGGDFKGLDRTDAKGRKEPGGENSAYRFEVKRSQLVKNGKEVTPGKEPPVDPDSIKSNGETDGLYSEWDGGTDDVVAGYEDVLQSGGDKEPWQLEGTEFAESYKAAPNTMEWYKNIEVQGLLPKLEQVLREKAYEDQDGHQWAWESFCEDLTNLMETVNPGEPKVWRVNMRGFGWMKEDSDGTVTANDGEELRQKVLPNTDCHFRVYKEGRGIKINNSHHDAPMGGEVYYLTPFDAPPPNPEPTPDAAQVAVAPEMADQLREHHEQNRQRSRPKENPNNPKTNFTPEQMDRAPQTPAEIETVQPRDRQQKVDALLDQYNSEQDPARKKQIEEQIMSLQASFLGRWLLRRAIAREPKQTSPGARNECSHGWPGKKPGERGWCGRCGL
jgi:hypothetical protein